MQPEITHTIELTQSEKNESFTATAPPKAQQSNIRFTTDGLPKIIIKKIQGLIQTLNEDVVDIAKLKKYLAEGIPDEAANVRQYCWKIILNYLPEDRSKWQSVIEKQKQTYDGLVKMFLPEEKFPDYPLLLKKDHPRFKELEEDYLLWEQIQKDTSRTHAQFSFFAMSSTEIMLPYLTSARREKFKLINGEDQMSYKQFLQSKQKQRKIYRYDYMTRILYIYSKLNPKIQYVQGMNQILAPIFYLVNVTKPANAIQQSSCFFMFNNAICDIIELHIKDLDKSKNGIYGKLNQVNQMLMVIEPQIWKRMEKLKIDPFFYCFRWVTLLYAQDFALFDTLRIWESIFSSENRIQYINFFAIAIIVSQNDFTVVLEYLQEIKDHVNINEVIGIANDLFTSYTNQDFNQLAKIQKIQIDKERKQYRQRKEKEEKNRNKELTKKKEKEEKQKEKEQRRKEKQTKMKKKQEEEKQEKQTLQSSGVQQLEVQKQQKTDDVSLNNVQKKIGGFFKKVGNMVDKFLN